MASNNGNFYYSLNAPLRLPFRTEQLNPFCLQSVGQPIYTQTYGRQQQQAVVQNSGYKQNSNIQVNDEITNNFPNNDAETDEEPDSDVWGYCAPTSLEYYMPNRDERGIGVVITNEKFHGGKDRSGVDKDRENIKKMFNTMRLKIIEIPEKSSREIIDGLKKVSKREVMKSHYVLVVAFSTHGDENDVLYGSDGAKISLRSDVISLFKPQNCKELEGKPKIFVIQACRGTREDHIVNKGIHRDASEKEEIVSNESDILIAYACAPSYRAYRTKREGSWYISDLYKNFESYHNNRDLVGILTITNQSLLLRVDIKDNKDNIAQASIIHSTLRKQLYLKSQSNIQESVQVKDPGPVTLCTLPKPNISSQFDLTAQSALEEEPILQDIQISHPIPNFNFLPKYDLSGEYSGLGIILVNHKCGKWDRPGSKKDLENFNHIFLKLKLKVVTKVDFSPKNVLKLIEEEVEKHQNLNSFFIAISTHGTNNDVIFCHDGTSMEVSEILSELQKPIYAGKPKVLLVQACRGNKEGTEVFQRNGRIVADSVPTVATLDSDVLKAYSCVEGYTASREVSVGSWFVASLRVCFDGLPRPCSILQLLTATNNYMLTQFKDRTWLGGIVRQPCEVTHTLCAELFI